MSDVPTDLFGDPITGVDPVPPGTQSRRKTVPRGYAAPPGSGPKGETCKTCVHYSGKRLAKIYRKCGLMQKVWTGGPGTDILARSPACYHFRPQLKTFEYRDFENIVKHTEAGGLAFSVWPGSYADHDKAPRCFRGLAEYGKVYGKDAFDLEALAKKLGVKVVVIDRRGQVNQHIDICRGPFERAKKLFKIS